MTQAPGAHALPLWLDTPLGRRSYGPEALPLSLGGGAEPIRLDVPPRAGPVARLVLEGSLLAIEPLRSSEAVLLNDRLLEDVTVLHPGDRIRAGRSELRLEQTPQGLELRSASGRGSTLPPVVSAGAASPDDEPSIEPAPVVLKSQRPEPSAARAARVALPSLPKPQLRLPRPALRAPRTRTIALWSALALPLLALVAIGATTVSVEIRSEPPGASVSLPDTLLKLPVAGRTLLRPGPHLARAELAGFEPREQPIEVPDSPDAPIVLALQPLPGTLYLRSTPVGAQVEIDGEKRGVTPLDALQVPAGTHALRLSAERHAPGELQIEVAGRALDQLVELALTPTFAPVTITSEPPGAQLRIDGAEVGTTPARVDVDAGEHRLELELAGFEPHEQPIAVQANAPQDLGSVKLAPARARIAVASDPEGASVTVDGKYRGTAPLTLAVEPGATVALRLEKRGYASAERSLQVRSGEQRELQVTLDAVLGSVELRVQPAGAQILVDGASAGSGSRTLQLSAVEHRIEVRKEGFAPFATTITPRAGFAKRLDVTLQPRRSAQGESAGSGLPQSAKTAGGAQLVLVEPGTLELGSAPGTQGRRANEVQRRVAITRPYYIGAREVSNAEFRAFRSDHAAGAMGTYTLDEDAQPAVQVSWDDAARYCNWLSEKESLPAAYVERGTRMVPVVPIPAGYRLPTEAEWALAARTGGAARALFPWGDDTRPPQNSGNYADQSATTILPVALTTYSDGFPVASPVGSFPPTSLGLFDIAGNAAEWVHDYYGVPQPDGTVEKDPVGPAEGVYHVIRGSSWRHATRTELRIEFRDYGDGPREDLGFRIARSAQ